MFIPIYLVAPRYASIHDPLDIPKLLSPSHPPVPYVDSPDCCFANRICEPLPVTLAYPTSCLALHCVDGIEDNMILSFYPIFLTPCLRV